MRRALAELVRCLNHSSKGLWGKAAWGLLSLVDMYPADPRVRSMLLQLPVLPAVVTALRRGSSSCGGGGRGSGGSSSGGCSRSNRGGSGDSSIGGGSGGDVSSRASTFNDAMCTTLPTAAILSAGTSVEASTAPTLTRLLTASDALEALAQQLAATAAAAAMAECDPGTEESGEGVLVAQKVATLLRRPLNQPRGRPWRGAGPAAAAACCRPLGQQWVRCCSFQSWPLPGRLTRSP